MSTVHFCTWALISKNTYFMSLKKKKKQGSATFPSNNKTAFLVISFPFLPLALLISRKLLKKKKVCFVSVHHTNMFPQKSNEL